MATLARRSRSIESQAPSSTAWMVTFSDLLTLLLTLFVLRLSMSSLSSQEIVEKIKIRSEDNVVLEPPTGSEQQSTTNPAPQATPDSQTELNDLVVDTLSESLGKPSATNGKKEKLTFNGDVSVEKTENGAIVSLGASTFESGSAELTFKAAESVSTLAKSLKDKKYRVRIAGHTDNIPINTVRFPSNWELSASRAIAVARQMIDAGVEEQIVSAVGYADTKPLEDNRNELGRHLNRRVEIYLTPIREDAN